uniref:protein ALP1-like n=1 Tax=Styela clava TaxID=7725 RepID=UPI001939B3CB|nr:protein ALP1-like [Styela clava]
MDRAKTLLAFFFAVQALVLWLHTRRIRRSRTLLALTQWGAERIPRKIWMEYRPDDWWLNALKNFGEQEWLSNFRIRRETFSKLTTLMRDDLEPDERCVRTPLSLDKRIAIAIYQLASTAEFRTTGNMFGVHRTSVHRYLHRFCECLIKHQKKFIFLPTAAEAKTIAAANQQLTGFPQCFGAIDGSHIHVKPPRSGFRDYVNRKMYPSIVLQAVADNHYRFRDISIKMPGSVHDATVLRASGLYKNAEMLPSGEITINGYPVPLCIVGDSAYPSLPWLLRPYTGSSLTPRQERYNEHHSKVNRHFYVFKHTRYNKLSMSYFCRCA